jgi:hypothetical protein
MAQVQNPYLLYPKFKAIATLFPYTIQQEQCGERGIFDAILHFLSQQLKPKDLQQLRPGAFTPFIFITQSDIFNNASPQAVVLAAPYMVWSTSAGAMDLVPKWVAAVSVVPYTEKTCQSIVDTLLQIAGNHSLQPYLPVDVWLWLNRRPHLPHVCLGRQLQNNCNAFQTVQALSNIEILTSYLILVWSEWHHLHPEVFAMMCNSIHTEFNGISMSYYRADLIQRLDYILKEVDQWCHINPKDGQWPNAHHGLRTKYQYGQLRRILLEVDQEATKTINGMSPALIYFSLLISP